MDRKEIENKVNQFLINEIEIEEDLIAPDALLTKDLGIDSLDVVDIIVIVEAEFGVRIKGEELKNVKTLQQFYEFIEKKIKNK